MPQFRIYDLAQDLGIKRAAEIVTRLNALGIRGKTSSSHLERDEVEKFLDRYFKLKPEARETYFANRKAREEKEQQDEEKTRVEKAARAEVRKKERVEAARLKKEEDKTRKESEKKSKEEEKAAAKKHAQEEKEKALDSRICSRDMANVIRSLRFFATRWWPRSIKSLSIGNSGFPPETK